MVEEQQKIDKKNFIDEANALKQQSINIIKKQNELLQNNNDVNMFEELEKIEKEKQEKIKSESQEKQL